MKRWTIASADPAGRRANLAQAAGAGHVAGPPRRTTKTTRGADVIRYLPVGLFALFTACAPAAMSTSPVAPAASTAATTQLEQLFADHWDFTLRESPLFATSVGDHRFNDRLGGASPADIERRAAAQRAFLDRLWRIDRSALPREEQVSYDMLVRSLSEALEAHRFRTHLMPLTTFGDYHTAFPQLHERVPLNTTRDYENFIARLRDFRRFSGEQVALLREGLQTGRSLPRVVLRGMDETIRPHIVQDPTQSRLWAPFDAFPATVPEPDRARLREAGRAAILESVVPAYRELLDFITGEYVPGARASVAAAELPDGNAYYEHLVRSFTTLDVTPAQVHETGLAEVRRIRAEMEEVIRQTGFDGSFAEFVHFLRTDPRFYVDTPDQLLMETAWVLKRMDGELPRLFGRLPRMPYGLKPIPDFIAPRTTTAYYSRPAGDGTRAGIYWLNTYNLPSRPLYEVEALSLHEAVPGHHLQIALQQELEGLPEFRRFSGATAFVEGWALYAERLGLEVGFYTDPYSNFGRLTYEMWRACRLVVDTGLHAKGWTRQQAIDFMAENTALTLLNITNEVDRYIAWPGQALAYKMGELKIRELRAIAERELGDGFDIRAFHDVVLGSGAVPLTVLDENVRLWIEEQRGGAE
jgi:uncharacterized protein (DUF885 family)